MALLGRRRRRIWLAVVMLMTRVVRVVGGVGNGRSVIVLILPARTRAPCCVRLRALPKEFGFGAAVRATTALGFCRLAGDAS